MLYAFLMGLLLSVSYSVSSAQPVEPRVNRYENEQEGEDAGQRANRYEQEQQEDEDDEDDDVIILEEDNDDELEEPMIYN